MRTLLAAKVALYLKESLGTRTSVLSKLMDAFTASQEELRTQNPNYVVFNCRLTADEEPIKLGVPFRALEAEVKKRMNRADLYKDVPRGRKRRGWKKEFLESLSEAAKDIGEISEEEILRTVRTYRKEKRAPRSPLSRKPKRRHKHVVVDTSAVVAGISGFKETYTQGSNASAALLMINWPHGTRGFL